MTNSDQGDSMWLQKSITLPDPFPSITGNSLLDNPEKSATTLPSEVVKTAENEVTELTTLPETSMSSSIPSPSPPPPSPPPPQLSPFSETIENAEVVNDAHKTENECGICQLSTTNTGETTKQHMNDITENESEIVNNSTIPSIVRAGKKAEVYVQDSHSTDTTTLLEPLEGKSFDMMCPPTTASNAQKSSPFAASIMSRELHKIGQEMTTCTPGSNTRSSLSRFSTRASISTANAFITSSEYDELRSRYTQAKRELLRLSDIQKDLEFTRFELERSQENVKLMRESYCHLKLENDEIMQRTEKAHKARLELETRMEAESATHAKEISFLKRQIEELRSENASRVEELTQQHEGEYQRRVQSMIEELNARDDEREQLVSKLEQLEADERSITERNDVLVHERTAMQESITELESKLNTFNDEYKSAERRFQAALREFESEHNDALRAHTQLSEERIAKITAMKDHHINEMQKELTATRDKVKSVSDELASTRVTIEQLNEEVINLKEIHAKELRQIEEQRQLNLCEWKVQMENAVREAKGGKFSLEEEIQSLRRQLDQLNEECVDVKKTLTQRDKDAQRAEIALSELTIKYKLLESENAQLESDYALSQNAVDDATNRIERLLSEKDQLEEDFTNDLHKAKSRIRELEQSLIETHNELSSLRKEHVQSNDEHRAIVTRLRQDLETANAERANLLRAVSENEQSQTIADEYRKKFTAEKQKAENLNVELSAAIGRCAALEKRLDEELRKVIATSVSRSSVNRKQSSLSSLSSSPPPPLTSTSASATVLGSTLVPSSSFSSRAPRMRSHSSLNASLSTPSANTVKRARTEDARVFAISGFDDNELLLSIKQLPNVAIAECKSNAPVPSNLTHLVTNGQLTIKLLSALVRGCWILPSSYITDSLKKGRWLNESDYGFQHSNPPLLKKRICLTDQFMSCKHYSTANLLLKEGGATIVSGEDENEADCILCTNAELTEIANGVSWEGLIASIYPVRVE